MGNGVSRTYPAGILKTPLKSVRFGKPEVREIQQDRWETRPLLNTHEVRRIEAKIRAAEMRPLERPKIIQNNPIIEKKSSGGKLAVIATLAVITGVSCGLAGPFGLVIPAAIIIIAAFTKLATAKPRISPEKANASSNALRHLDKLIKKHEQAGLTEQAAVYREMAARHRRKYGL